MNMLNAKVVNRAWYHHRRMCGYQHKSSTHQDMASHRRKRALHWLTYYTISTNQPTDQPTN